MADETGAHTTFSPEHRHVIGVVRRLFQCYTREQEARAALALACAQPFAPSRVNELRGQFEHAEFMLNGAILEAWDLLCPRDPAADRKDAIKEPPNAVR